MIGMRLQAVTNGLIAAAVAVYTTDTLAAVVLQTLTTAAGGWR